MFDNQSKTFFLLQPPVPQAPLFSQPATFPFFADPQEHPIKKFLRWVRSTHGKPKSQPYF